MDLFEVHPPLTAKERAEKRRLMVRDFVALFTLVVITVAIGVLTYFLFSSFSRHRDVLARRWRANGERELREGHPDQAIDALRSALQYAPGQRDIEIELAMALAADNRNLEAMAYFNTLLETEPGNGLIHLQVARLAAKEGNAALAEEHYQQALDGTWGRDGYLQRLSVRLELAKYLISQKDYTRAQTQLRTASDNALNMPEKQMEIGELMEQAHDPSDALAIYLAQMRKKGAPIDAFVGAGRTAYALGQIELARRALERAVEHPEFAKQNPAEQQAVRQMLSDSQTILELYPDPNLSVRERAERISNDARIAHSRLTACFASANASGEMANLQGQWQQIPARVTVRMLERNPQLEQTIMSLVYDTEEQTAQVCGAPTGDDALLLKIAQAPLAVQQQ
ncbi:MAG TPA: tetratricopeptide repeat protein [Acidobacteriaceae bacterium]|nr:tetratricopeptide repeat protein [Acidobacteriaceae bacterium]